MIKRGPKKYYAHSLFGFKRDHAEMYLVEFSKSLDDPSEETIRALPEELENPEKHGYTENGMNRCVAVMNLLTNKYRAVDPFFKELGMFKTYKDFIDAPNITPRVMPIKPYRFLSPTKFTPEEEAEMWRTARAEAKERATALVGMKFEDACTPRVAMDMNLRVFDVSKPCIALAMSNAAYVTVGDDGIITDVHV